ncbi:potassium channel beta subunit family protein [Aurantibacillus circumpalustris]|uniref:potassium channel beta subunit family protein n=1 Tax=Aurantibacillus circumpalustris TaxID=3036359 RepID=UPI00295B3DB4|nr:aldo/keto reductase [Aurantibacillus circumpalustris]
MEYRRLGKSGLQLSVLSFGSWVTFGKQIGNTTADELMSIAYDNGVNFFDNAEVYARGKSELVMGEVLKNKTWSRSSYCLSSKIYFGYEENKPNQMGLSRKHIVEGCHAALKRLQLDYIDLLFCHRPDKSTPIEETVWAMNTLIQQGKILYWGTSEWANDELMAAFVFAEKNHLIGPTMEQPQYNMFERTKIEKDFLLLFRDFGLGTTIWSPLASGLLTGKYNSGMPSETRLTMEGMDWLKERTLGDETRIEKTRHLNLLAKELGITLPKLGIAWCIKNPNVSTAILGASKPEQLKENLTAIDVLPLLTVEVIERIETILQNKPVQPLF